MFCQAGAPSHRRMGISPFLPWSASSGCQQRSKNDTKPCLVKGVTFRLRLAQRPSGVPWILVVLMQFMLSRHDPLNLSQALPRGCHGSPQPTDSSWANQQRLWADQWWLWANHRQLQAN